MSKTFNFPEKSLKTVNLIELTQRQEEGGDLRRTVSQFKGADGQSVDRSKVVNRGVPLNRQKFKDYLIGFSP